MDMPLIWPKPELRSGAGLLASVPQDETAAFLKGLSENARIALPWLFEFWAMPHQLPPEGDWKTWVILGGRGAGKTRAGAEWVRSQVEGAGPKDAGAARRVALVGEAIEQVREVMVFGDSGILACTPADRRPKWEATRKRLAWNNGAVAQVFSEFDPDALRGPQFDCAWVDELGCAAIDKGTNQPNVFLDPKSSESAVPDFSSGMRDDLIQSQYLRASFGHWADSENNPVSSIYGGSMVDMDHAHVWAWDARPWLEFPNNLELWSDGENYARGHWINGRLGAQALADVVAEICEDSGVVDYDVSTLYGSVKGFFVDQVQTGRASIQPLMLSFGFDAVERDGQLLFENRKGVAVAEIDPARLVWSESEPTTLQSARLPKAETAGKIRLAYFEADLDYQVGGAEAIFPDEVALGVAASEVPLVLSPGEARAVAERWLAESRVARDTVSFGLPPSELVLGAGDVVKLPDDLGGSTYRIDRIEVVGARMAEATRVEQSLYIAAETKDEAIAQSSFVSPVPVFPLFMDLPLLTGEEAEHIPHLAVTATPWPGSVAVYSSSSDAGYELNSLVEASSIIGISETAVFKADAGRWDRGPGVRVKVYGGTLSSVSSEDVLNGANVAAIGDDSGANWEVFQFRDSILVGDGVYELTGLLRGQAGSDGLVPDDWPVGSHFILLNGKPAQIELAASARDLARHYRIGPALRSYNDPSYVHEIHAFSGIGLKPYGPAHLRVAKDSAGDLHLTWVRRTRIDGDSWSSVEVPLGEASEAYQVRVMAGGALLRSTDVSSSSWIYAAAQQLTDGVPTTYEIEVAQISERFGTGHFTRIEIND